MKQYIETKALGDQQKFQDISAASTVALGSHKLNEEISKID